MVEKKRLTALKTDSMPVNNNSCVCSAHFEGGKRTGMDDVPLVFSFSKVPTKKKAPAVCIAPPPKKKDIESGPDVSAVESSGAEPDKNRLLEGKLASVESELERCRARVKKLEEENVILQAKSRSFCYDVIKEDDNLVRFYTGLPDSAAFGELFSFVEDSLEDLVYWSGSKTSRRESTSRAGRGKRNPTQTLSCHDELLMTLIKLQLDPPYLDLAQGFKISVSTVSRIVTTWILLLDKKLRAVNWWSSREQVDATMPEQFKDLYPSTRAIMDCTEFEADKPSGPDSERVTWSSYKNRNTFKALIGITPGGAISYVSPLFSGSVSDKKVTCSSGFMDLLQPGDSIMADKGFNIADICEKYSVVLNIPPYLGKDSQLQERDRIETRRIASLSVHVERAMQRIKRYHILGSISSSRYTLADNLVFICSMLGN